MPTEDSADHEFVFLVHKNAPPGPSSSITSLSSSASSSSSSGSSSTCRVPKFPHLRPIPIELEESFSSGHKSPPRSPPPFATCSSRMSPLPQELLELMPPKLKIHGYTNPANSEAPTRPPPPVNYAPTSDYCLVGDAEHNYEYLRELVTSDAIAVLANNSSPVTSLARSAVVRARTASPSRPDIVPSSRCSQSMLPSPKFTRTSTSINETPSSKTSVTTLISSSSSSDVKNNSNNSINSSPISYKAVLTNNGISNPVLKKVPGPTTPFLASFRSAGGAVASTTVTSRVNIMHQNNSGSISDSGIQPAYNNSKTSSTPVPNRRAVMSTEHLNSTEISRNQFAMLPLNTPNHNGKSKMPSSDQYHDRNDTKMNLPDLPVIDQSNYVVNKYHFNKNTPSNLNNKNHPYYIHSNQNGTKPINGNNVISFSNNQKPNFHYPMRDGSSSDTSSYRTTRIDGSTSDSVCYTNKSRNSFINSKPMSPISVRPAHGITKLSYPLNDKYTNVLAANTSSGKYSSDISVPPPMEKLRISKSNGSYASQRLSDPQVRAAANIQEKLFPPAPPVSDESQMSYTNLNSSRVSPQSSRDSSKPHIANTSSSSNVLPSNASSPKMQSYKYPQSGCHPVPNNENEGRRFFSGINSVDQQPSINTFACPFSSGSASYGPPSLMSSTSPILSKLPYQGEHQVIHPLPAPPVNLLKSRSTFDSDDNDCIYDNLMVSRRSNSPSTRVKILEDSRRGTTNLNPVNSKQPNYSMTTSECPSTYQCSPPIYRRSESPQTSHCMVQNQQAYTHYYQPDQHRSVNHTNQQQCQSPHYSPTQKHTVLNKVNQFQNYQAAEHQCVPQPQPRYWPETCPTCRQPQSGGLYRSSSCEKFASSTRPSPSTSPSVGRRGGSASPSLRHSPSPDPGGGLGKPPRPRRQQQYRRVVYSPPKQPLICSSPGCTIPHIHQTPMQPTPQPRCYQETTHMSHVSHMVPCVSMHSCHGQQPHHHVMASHTFKNVSAMNPCTVLTSSEPQYIKSPVDPLFDPISISDDAKNKGTAGHKSFYKSMRNLLMPNQQ